MSELDSLPILKTKLGPARLVSLVTLDGRRSVRVFHSAASGRPLADEESRAARGPVFRAAFLASDGKYPGRVPFRAVFGVVGGAGRVLVYDRFGLAIRFDEAKPAVRRRGLKLLAGREEILALLASCAPAVLGYAGAYRCPACGVERAEPLPPEGHLRMPLCAGCLRHGRGERDWVGTWQCPHCGDRVKEDVLLCPLCGRFEAEGKA